MKQTLRIVIPTAGFATRMRPQTWSKPKPLVSVAGETALYHLLDTFKTIPPEMDVEYILIVGPGLGEQQIPPYLEKHFPGLKVHYVLQPEMRGQSDAIWLGRKYLSGPTLVTYSDTLIETDFSFLAREKADGVAWVKTVQDPRRFGVAKTDAEGWITQLEEKPRTVENKLAVVGCYYFREGRSLVSAIQEQIRRKMQFQNEFFLVHALNIMLDRGAKIRTQKVDTWLDTGTIDATLETNRFLLDRSPASTSTGSWDGGHNRIVPPVFIHPSARVSNSVIGPYVSIGADCQVTGSRVDDSIIEEGATIKDAVLKNSFVGRQAQVRGHSANDPPLKLNIGDDCSVILE